MAITTLDSHAPATRALPVRIAAAIGLVFTRMAMMSDAARAAHHAGELAQLSDEQLAARGLTRDGIVAHAFRNLTWR